MLKNTVNNNSILFDLEYRGIDQAISSFTHTGLKVPKAMVSQVSSIIKENYDIDMEVINESSHVESGCFCLVEYIDEPICLIKSR